MATNLSDESNPSGTATHVVPTPSMPTTTTSPCPSRSPYKHPLLLFCEVSSIRGLYKISRGDLPFLRTVWTVFIVVMTTVLLMTSTFLVREYFTYRTAWTTSVSRDLSDFPAVTICPQNPFSLQANEEWRKPVGQRIMTPAEYTEKLSQISLYALDHNISDAIVLRLYDKFSNYFMNLRLTEVAKLGHNKTMLRYCIVQKVDGFVVGEDCDIQKQTPFHIELLMQEEYFTCFTIEGKAPGSTQGVDSLSVVVELTPTNIIPQLENSFVMDVLNRGEGLRVVVHEPNTLPDVMLNGINLPPAKINAIVYSATQSIRYASPVSPCLDENSTLKAEHLIRNLDRQYNYTHVQCVHQHIQRMVLQNCHCQLSRYPLQEEPSAHTPYCFQLPSEPRFVEAEMLTRLMCVDDILLKAQDLHHHLTQTECPLRCRMFTYETTTSFTKWHTDNSKLRQVTNLYRTFDAFKSNESDVVSRERLRSMLVKNFAEISDQADPANADPHNHNTIDSRSPERYAFVQVTRKSAEFIVKTEKLELDVSILLSRIGGLCSICIGLTASFFVELVEFCYLLARNSKEKGSSKNRRPRHDTHSRCIAPVMKNICTMEDCIEVMPLNSTGT